MKRSDRLPDIHCLKNIFILAELWRVYKGVAEKFDGLMLRHGKGASSVATLSLYKNIAVLSSRVAQQLVTSLSTDVFVRAP